MTEDTDPHCAAEQETFQVTPLLEESRPTVAVTEAVPPAGTDVESAETVTLMTGGGGVVELPLPLQPVSVITEVNPKRIRRTDAGRFMAPPHGSIFAMARRQPLREV